MKALLLQQLPLLDTEELPFLKPVNKLSQIVHPHLHLVHLRPDGLYLGLDLVHLVLGVAAGGVDV